MQVFERSTSHRSVRVWGWDGRGQLINAGDEVAPDVQSYVWDMNGNRTQLDDIAGPLGTPADLIIGPGNQLLHTLDFNYSYDEEGNRSGIGSDASIEFTAYEWDNRNRLTSVTEQAFAGGYALRKVAYTYDPFDRRVSKAVDTDGDGDFDYREFYIWDQDNPSGIDNVLLDFVDADGDGTASAPTLNKRYLYGNAVDQIFAQENVGQSGANAVDWLLQDNLGSVRDVVDNAGNVINRIDYDAFGNILSVIDPSNSDVATELATRFLFTGQEWDSDVGLHYYNARWYDPVTGTFISKDPLSFAAGDANLYRYVGNDPTNAIDPSGMDLIPWNPDNNPPSTNPNDFRPYVDGSPPGPPSSPKNGPCDNPTEFAASLAIYYLILPFKTPLSYLPFINPDVRSYETDALAGSPRFQMRALAESQRIKAIIRLKAEEEAAGGACSGSGHFKDFKSIIDVSIFGDGLLGFALNSPYDLHVFHDVTYSWCKGKEGGQVDFTIDSEYVWHDVLDWNSFAELWRRGQFSSGSDAVLGGVLEGSLDLLHDKVLDLEFELFIKYRSLETGRISF